MQNHPYRRRPLVMTSVTRLALLSIFVLGTIVMLFRGFRSLMGDQNTFSQTGGAMEEPFDMVSSTATDLQRLLMSGAIKSEDIVERSLAQIKKHDPYLKAVLTVSPSALEAAKSLDRERRYSGIRGPLHGIPILIKDNIDTDHNLGMPTTAGTYALRNARPKANAAVIMKLIEAGAIVLAKTQLSELAFYKGSDLPSGWSALGGQAQSAYTTDDVQPGDGSIGFSNPGGSSTGSAVGISAGYAPIALGTDTTGSIIFPATRAALYGLRVTTSIAPMAGVLPLSRDFDSIGPMAKNVLDIANILDCIIDKQPKNPSDQNYSSNLPGEWSTLRIGAVDPESWYISSPLARPNEKAQAQINEETLGAYERIKRLAKSFQMVDLISADDLKMSNGDDLFTLFEMDFRQNIDNYLGNLSFSEVRSLAEMVQYNRVHATLALPKEHPSQSLLEKALANNMAPERRTQLYQHVVDISRRRGINYVLDKYKVDVIIGPANSAFNLLVCGAGYPSATMPLSYLDINGLPFGVFAITNAHGEATLLKTMSAWEQTFAGRKVPPGF